MLVAVHVLILIHVAQWLLVGTTLSPVEPSEMIQTLRDGLVNAGFVMFVVAIVSTLVVGRFFCGWACHIVALQDLCSHVMTRLGVRPKPFRSRILVWTPLALALYMFVWPIAHRAIIRPTFADAMGRLPAWLGQSRPWPGATGRFIVEDFWATFPSWYVAIPLLAICGFVCVYFLGSKGFCTYGCPYGGVFGPVERLAPGRIRVNDNCEQCGHCTAVCTSNVRVHEEVRDFGMVVDPGCMKCLDCVSVCPNDALSLGFGAPAIGARPLHGRERSAAEAAMLRRARYDPTLAEDLALGVLMLLLVLAFRGMLNQVPLLMAAGLGGVAAFGAWTSWRLWRSASVRVQSVQLKLKGRMRPAGWVFVLVSTLILAAGAWSGLVRWWLWKADLAYAKLETPANVVLDPQFHVSVEEREAAEAAVGFYTLAGSRSGAEWGAVGGSETLRGWGWSLDAHKLANLAYADLVLGRFDAAEAALREVMRRGHPQDALIFQLAQVMRRRGEAPAEIDSMLAAALESHPTLPGVRSAIAHVLLERGDTQAAAALWSEAVASHPKNLGMIAEAARFQAAELHQFDAARALLTKIDPVRTGDVAVLTSGAGVWLRLGEQDRARQWARQAAERSRPGAPTGTDTGVAWLLDASGLPEEALRHARAASTTATSRGPYIGRADALLQAGLFERHRGDRAAGLTLIRTAATIVETSPWDLLGASQAIASQARATNDAELASLGEQLAAQAGSKLKR